MQSTEAISEERNWTKIFVNNSFGMTQNVNKWYQVIQIDSWWCKLIRTSTINWVDIYQCTVFNFFVRAQYQSLLVLLFQIKRFNKIIILQLDNNFISVHNRHIDELFGSRKLIIWMSSDTITSVWLIYVLIVEGKLKDTIINF